MMNMRMMKVKLRMKSERAKSPRVVSVRCVPFFLLIGAMNQVGGRFKPFYDIICRLDASVLNTPDDDDDVAGNKDEDSQDVTTISK